MNQAFLAAHEPAEMTVAIVKIEDSHGVSCDGGREVEMDEMWSDVGSKAYQGWLWHAIDQATGTVLAYVLGEHKDPVFLELKGLLEPFGMIRVYTDDWGSYRRYLDPEHHVIGKRNTQKTSVST